MLDDNNLELCFPFFFQDGTLSGTMTGHKSVVSAIGVNNGVLYSGSWDGTVRLWSLSDHSLLTVLGEDMPRAVSTVLSLAADQHTLIATYENGSVKVLCSSNCCQICLLFSYSHLCVYLFPGNEYMPQY